MAGCHSLHPSSSALFRGKKPGIYPNWSCNEQRIKRECGSDSPIGCETKAMHHQDSPALLNQSAPKSILPPGLSRAEVTHSTFSLDVHSRRRTFARPHGFPRKTGDRSRAGKRGVALCPLHRRSGSRVPDRLKVLAPAGGVGRAGGGLSAGRFMGAIHRTRQST